MSEVKNTTDAETRSVEFVKVATLAALHIQAVNSAVQDGDVESLKGSVEFGEKVAQTILAQVPQDVQVEVLMDLLGTVLGK